MTTVEEYNRYGEDLERLLRLRTSPIAVKMLEREADIPPEAIRPKKDRGYHLSQCQAFALSRRQRATVAMLKEDHWCWAPLMAYGLVEDPHDPFVNSHAFFPSLEYGKYIGMLTAPLDTASFIPDMVLVYSNTAQLRQMLFPVKYTDKILVTSQFDPIDSCAYSVVPTIQKGEYRITLPDPGEYARAAAGDDEIIFSIPAEKVGTIVEGLRQSEEMRKKGDDFGNIEMRPDFPRPEFYKKLFEMWGLDVEE